MNQDIITLRLATVRYNKMLDDGTSKSVTEQLLIDSTSYTEAEAKAYAYDGYATTDRVTIESISIPRVLRCLRPDEWKSGADHRWFRAKINYLTVDPKTYKLKKNSLVYFVEAGTLEEALRLTITEASALYAGWDIVSLTETSIIDYITYGNDADSDED